MKKFVVRYSAWVVLAVMLIMLIPGISLRINSESSNNNITISLLYNNIVNKISDDDFDMMLTEAKKIGVDTVSVMEDDINYLVAKGDVTCIKYNVLRHKYDLESIQIAEIIKEKCPDVSYDSYILIVDDDKTKRNLKKWLPMRFSDEDYVDVGSVGILDVYVLLDGRVQTWDYALGYDEEAIEQLKNKGFNVALVHKVKNYANTKYLEDIDRIVKKYDIEFLNLKKDTVDYEDKKDVNKKNYEGIADIINNNDMTLVVTENSNNLSNQECFGYDYIFSETMKDGGSKKVVRSFETYDDSGSKADGYKYRSEQFLNSTIDRNSRFITVTLMEPADITYTECVEYTINAVEYYKEKMEKQGFTINSDVNKTDYFENKPYNSAVCAVIMIMFVLLMIQMVTGRSSFVLTCAALIISALAFAASFVMPESLLSLYPTAYSVLLPCFAMTCVLYFVKTMMNKLPFIVLAVSTLAVMMAVLLAGSVGTATLLSGIEYYINNDIYRGIKLSLVVPVMYTAVVFYFMFIKSSGTSVVAEVKKVMVAQIKVYWVIVAGVIGYIGMYYIVRSGNVSSISSIEQMMRSTLTDLFIARPRTKEFLIGYPALVLLVYYMKNINISIFKWLLAIAASILAASVTNSFCHVFTDYSIIMSRTFNGLLIGIAVSIVAYVANLILVRIVKVAYDKIN